jgi:hypothetical protein
LAQMLSNSSTRVMSRITKHINLLSSVVALLFAFGSSGLAVVIHNCTMATPMECCQNMGDQSAADCNNPIQASGIPSFHGDANCSSSSLVGGLITNPGVVDNNRLVQKISVTVLPMNHCLSCVQTLTRSVPVIAFAGSISPPSVEKHILNASFLI